MTVTFEQSLKDVYDWIEYQRGKRKAEFPLRAIVTLVIIGYGFLQRGQSVVAWVLIAVAIGMAAGPLLAPWQRSTWRRRLEMAEKVDESGKLPETMRPKRTLTLEQGGLRVVEHNAHREVLHYWAALEEITELERIVAVRIGVETLLIPKRAFINLEESAAFVAELQGKMPVRETQETPAGEP
ncbi:hypothetical protein [Armatimonas sp.]|uniref:hypothetical protein n=1 Tax=Armatimonas sp. TaxID=1872638 RepID=UPI003752D694